jgi:hypothetical protein
LPTAQSFSSASHCCIAPEFLDTKLDIIMQPF